MEYALRDRYLSDHFFDYFELEYVLGHREVVLDELLYELAHFEDYVPGVAYAYYPPKSDLCFRRMVYLPFKDLALRYALVCVLADHLDPLLSPRCYANRRAREERRETRFLDNFATTSWPAFCSWQREAAKTHDVLLRTDISAFYDSISHERLVDTVADALSIDTSRPLMEFFRKMLRVPVRSYSYLDKRLVGPEVMQQGLPIGNTTEGFLANLYLRPVDDVMQDTQTEFGRYNDDMRLFAASRSDALDAVLVLQQELLGRCLNLNASKTSIAETEAKIEELRSKDHEVYGYLPDYDFVPDIAAPMRPDALAENEPAVLDQPFDRFDRTFTHAEEFKKGRDAKEFCKFLSKTGSSDSLNEQAKARRTWHVRRLEEVLVKWKGSSRHAAWLLVQSACFRGVPKRPREEARALLFRALGSPDVAAYAKYRVLHHLIKPRASRSGSKFRLFDSLSEAEQNRLQEAAVELVSSPAIELSLTALYALRALGLPNEELVRVANAAGATRHPGPVVDSLSLLAEPEEARLFLELGSAEEPDSYGEPY